MWALSVNVDAVNVDAKTVDAETVDAVNVDAVNAETCGVLQIESEVQILEIRSFKETCYMYGPTVQRTDGMTDPLLEMRGRI